MMMGVKLIVDRLVHGDAGNNDGDYDDNRW